MSQQPSSANLRGDVLAPGDDEYAEASTTVFGTGAPALVVRPRDAGEVAAAIEYARAADLVLSVRSGGHSVLGSGTNTGGLVLDLTHLDAVDVVDPATRIVSVGGGANWGQVATTLAPYGLGLTAGDTADVGVGGLTLGGGMGWMVRKYGLAIDNLVGAQIVTADGRILEAGEDEHAELFWAVRGGGGNFGVVTRFDFVAQPVETVHFGTITYQLDDPASTIRGWRDHMRTAPEELTSTLTLMPSMFGMPASIMVTLCYAGDDFDAAVAGLLSLGTVTDNNVQEMPYADTLEDAAMPPGMRVVARNALVPSLGDALIDAVIAVYRSEVPTMTSIRSLGGAFGRVSARDTAFAHRDAEAMVFCGAVLAADATQTDVDRALAPWPDVERRGNGAYLNFHGSGTPDDVLAAYPGETYERLVAVKRAYDAENTFALNHNISPRADEAAARVR
ncbi:FAD-binding oxidoreductase [Solicola gregarius]|uniref:FAD-binding oxidoreductase n=1 Tax=Solicola gregarius TaxID=2908642 RepID=A0AA46TJA3_9ACTN|nr:FAD-binding oxidoreductase [Solicola gregarius]UYM06384.1 FAD-binding oxidoreductase [Solicola gregarius]